MQGCSSFNIFDSFNLWIRLHDDIYAILLIFYSGGGSVGGVDGVGGVGVGEVVEEV